MMMQIGVRNETDCQAGRGGQGDEPGIPFI